MSSHERREEAMRSPLLRLLLSLSSQYQGVCKYVRAKIQGIRVSGVEGTRGWKELGCQGVCKALYVRETKDTRYQGVRSRKN